MYSNNILTFQASTTILNAYTKKSGNLLKAPRNCIKKENGPLTGRCQIECVVCIRLKYSTQVVTVTIGMIKKRVHVGLMQGPFKQRYYDHKSVLGGARGVMVIVVGNGHGDMSSNPGRDWLNFT